MWQNTAMWLDHTVQYSGTQFVYAVHQTLLFFMEVGPAHEVIQHVPCPHAFFGNASWLVISSSAHSGILATIDWSPTIFLHGSWSATNMVEQRNGPKTYYSWVVEQSWLIITCLVMLTTILARIANSVIAMRYRVALLWFALFCGLSRETRISQILV